MYWPWAQLSGVVGSKPPAAPRTSSRPSSGCSRSSARRPGEPSELAVRLWRPPRRAGPPGAPAGPHSTASSSARCRRTSTSPPALSGVTFSTTMNSADVPGWSMSRTWSWNCLSTALLVTLPHQRAHPRPDRHAQERDEEQHAEQHPPEHPGRAGPHRVVVGDDPDLALLVPDDRRHRVGLDDPAPAAGARPHPSPPARSSRRDTRSRSGPPSQHLPRSQSTPLVDSSAPWNPVGRSPTSSEQDESRADRLLVEALATKALTVVRDGHLDDYVSSRWCTARTPSRPCRGCSHPDRVMCEPRRPVHHGQRPVSAKGSHVGVHDLDDVPNWRGRDVIDSNGHAVGVITDLYVDDATGRPGGPWSRARYFGHHVTFVPLSAASAE